jgi:hypothetical protein
MRRFVLSCGMALLVGCARSERRPATDTTAAGAALPAPSATVALADFAGRWQVRGSSEAGESLVSYELIGTGDTSGWAIVFPGRPPIPVRIVAVAGDSIITEAGPYESVLRKGVQVQTRAVMRLQGGALVGTTVARYATSGPDSVLHIRAEGTRIP